MEKILYCIRHGESLHNVLYKKYGSDIFSHIEYKDTLLTPLGHKQSKNLSKTFNNIDEIELIIVSPLKRTLQTAKNIFESKKIPMISLDYCREYPLGLHTCNKRSSKEELEILYPDIDFQDLKTNFDETWLPDRLETIDELETRIKKFLNFVKNRPEKKIAFINHSGFIGQMKDKHIKYLDNNEEELKHCYPYEFKLEGS